jgi:hypothetical protein
MKTGSITKCSFRHALWVGAKEPFGPMRVYVHGEYKDRTGKAWLSVSKGDKPTIYSFGVKPKDIVWLEDIE